MNEITGNIGVSGRLCGENVRLGSDNVLTLLQWLWRRMSAVHARGFPLGCSDLWKPRKPVEMIDML